jgi:hypothetical protein
VRRQVVVVLAMILVSALAGGCASEEDPGLQGKGSTHASNQPTSSAAAQAKKASQKYEAIERAYVRSSKDLATVVSGSHAVSTTALRAAVRKAAAGFEARLRALRRTEWPPSARRYVRRYLAVASTKGRALFARARKARTVSDLKRSADVQTASLITRADQLMRAHLVSH